MAQENASPRQHSYVYNICIFVLTLISHLLGREQRRDLFREVVQKRSHYTALVTVLLTIIVLTTTSVLLLQFESKTAEANITTGWDALRYSIVTITTLGYSDLYPLSFWGWVTAVFIMVAGVGLIGVMASLWSSLLIGDQSETEMETSSISLTIAVLEMEVASINEKLDELLQHFNNQAGDLIYTYQKVAGDAR